MPMRRELYPEDWEAPALEVKEAAGWKCQACGMQCRRAGVPLGSRGHRETLPVAHLDHDPENLNARLRALCAPCHLRYDAAARRIRNAKRKEARK